MIETKKNTIEFTNNNSTNTKGILTYAESNNTFVLNRPLYLSDNSNKSLEERLTELGFKEGSVTGVSGATLTKQGKYAILEIPENSIRYTANEQKTTTLTMSFTAASKITSYILLKRNDSSARMGDAYEITIEGNKVTLTTPDMGNLGAPIIHNQKFNVGFEIISW